MSLVQLSYVSAATHLMSEAELEAILASSMSHNAECDLTGMLLYLDGTFLQVLEGPPGAVHETYERIKRDPRHHDLMLIDEAPITTRDFPNWRMGFNRLDPSKFEAYPAYLPLLRYGFDPQALSVKPGLAADFLRNFVINNR